ncbi:ABC-2 type transport system ATP-binding protein [Kribbella sp. VKM Ac-2571]|uniref:ABC transporter ATP-binding protein n=1 Tax=Kribbella sp. VKM Ac-2571 TaxID=2512222 RepID=UPI0010607366|nr:ABC transporter ATP-binding protein [Kribbella sp. VKM Ac-2571]TDO48340.1 ABC-2 type transport system ATP-binding protein [Kribbella sp. VKM Ac-2571]
MDHVIRTRNLTKRFGHRTALEGLDLDVPPGIILGYLGPNGAGKTTTIRLLAGLIRPTSGSAVVFGFDASDQYDALQQRIGYLPGDFVAYPDLTGAQYLDYFAHLYGGVDRARTDLLAKRFDLDLGVRIGALSRGNRQKVGIVQAFMHDPDLLILDEPTTGLDPLMQREFRELLRETRDAGRTVFLSSHVLSEVDAVADTVAILRAGRLVTVQSVQALRDRARRRLDLTFAAAPPVDRIHAAAGVQQVSIDGRVVHVVITGSTAELIKTVAPYGVTNVVSHEADLEAAFLDYYDGQE